MKYFLACLALLLVLPLAAQKELKKIKKAIPLKGIKRVVKAQHDNEWYFIFTKTQLGLWDQGRGKLIIPLQDDQINVRETEIPDTYVIYGKNYYGLINTRIEYKRLIPNDSSTRFLRESSQAWTMDTIMNKKGVHVLLGRYGQLSLREPETGHTVNVFRHSDYLVCNQWVDGGSTFLMRQDRPEFEQRFEGDLIPLVKGFSHRIDGSTDVCYDSTMTQYKSSPGEHYFERSDLPYDKYVSAYKIHVAEHLAKAFKFDSVQLGMLTRVWSKGKVGYMALLTPDFCEAWQEPQYDALFETDRFIIPTKDGLFGLVDGWTGEILLPVKYKNLEVHWGEFCDAIVMVEGEPYKVNFYSCEVITGLTKVEMEGLEAVGDRTVARIWTDEDGKFTYSSMGSSITREAPPSDEWRNPDIVYYDGDVERWFGFSGVYDRGKSEWVIEPKGYELEPFGSDLFLYTSIKDSAFAGYDLLGKNLAPIEKGMFAASIVDGEMWTLTAENEVVKFQADGRRTSIEGDRIISRRNQYHGFGKIHGEMCYGTLKTNGEMGDPLAVLLQDGTFYYSDTYGLNELLGNDLALVIIGLTDFGEPMHGILDLRTDELIRSYAYNVSVDRQKEAIMVFGEDGDLEPLKFSELVKFRK